MTKFTDQIKTAKEMRDSEAKRKEFNDRMVKITNKYQAIYGFEINKDYPKHETWNNEADAFKHTFGSALMVFEMGDIGSLAGGIRHEKQTENNPKGEWNMDSWNNRAGREIAKEIKKEYGEKEFRSLSQEKQEDIIAIKVMVKMKNGDLITNPDDKREFKGFWEEKFSKPKDTPTSKPKSDSANFTIPISYKPNNTADGIENDLTNEDYKAMIEGFDSGIIADEDHGIKRLNHLLSEYNKDWKKQFNVGDPNTDKGHWVTMNGSHVFIKDKV